MIHKTDTDRKEKNSVQYLFFFSIITNKGNCMFQNDKINVIIISVLWKICVSVTKYVIINIGTQKEK